MFISLSPDPATTPNLVYFKNLSSLFTITTFPLYISKFPFFSLIGAPSFVPIKRAYKLIPFVSKFLTSPPSVKTTKSLYPIFLAVLIKFCKSVPDEVM